MTTFLEDVLIDLKHKNLDLSELVFVLPSKRAGTFLKHYIARTIDKPVFSPKIYSIEEFVEELSDLKSVSNIELLFSFYKSYKNAHGDNKLYSFDEFSQWAQILIQDFNEIDRHLILQNNIFDYLTAVKEISHWSMSDNKTTFIENYLTFWRSIKSYYHEFKKTLISKGHAYQGLLYREAVENIHNYIENSTNKKHVFVGFNALNTAEETIIQEILENGLGYIYWDIDKVFFNSTNHDAGLFLRKYNKSWNYLNNNSLNWLSEYYCTSKNIEVIGVPKRIGQAKHIGNLLSLLNEKKGLSNTAVVLSDETLLLPLLNSIPESIKRFNITMGLKLNTLPLASLFEKLFYVQKKRGNTIYFKDVVSILSHEFVALLFENNKATTIINTIQNNNIVYLTEERLQQIEPEYKSIISILFGDWQNDIKIGLKNFKQLILQIKSVLDANKNNNLLSLEYLYQFYQLFSEIEALNDIYNYINDINSLHHVYKELLGSKTLDFKGKPLEGLQIMGMLESRVLDFETVIISSVNEGILPSGKTQNSFIPFDVKLENNLPTYKEKDAIYTYHFYKLINRAKNVYILYNTEIDAFSGGEESRFIKQLEFEGIHKINRVYVSPEAPIIKNELNTINKKLDVQERLKQIAQQGFSPSSLTLYIRNPIDFYYQKILKIREYDIVEETVAANTLGTVIHNTLEDLYKPFVGKIITAGDVEKMKALIGETVVMHFNNVYLEGNISKGKNLITYEIAKRYILNYLDLEIHDLKSGNIIEILAVERENKIEINIPEVPFPISLKGTVDRVDKRNGVIRIIDYKTGKVDKGKVEIVNWEDITTNYDKYSKSFQVLCYALIMKSLNNYNQSVEAGIISFKNLNQGFLKFAKKDKPGAYGEKKELIDESILNEFSKELHNLIIEICNPNIPFLEKTI